MSGLWQGQVLLVLGDANDMPCESSKLVVYKVTFDTFWDREIFPKQYPEWRPPAQWSKLVGKIVFIHYKSFKKVDNVFKFPFMRISFCSTCNNS